MQKKLIALAVAGLSTAAFAQTNVTIYGVADVSAQGTTMNKSVAPGSNPADGSAFNLKNNSSLIGFKGTEDLGNGLKGLFQIETNVNMTGQSAGQGVAANTTNSNFGSLRDTYVGASSKYGTVMGGYLSTPFRSALTSFDVMPGATGDGRIENLLGGFRMSGSTVGLANSTGYLAANSSVRATALAYAMPTLYGFTGAIAYTGSNNNGGSNQTTVGPVTVNSTGGMTSQTNLAPQSALSLNLGWEGYGFGIKGAFQQAKVNNSATLTAPIPVANINNVEVNVAGSASSTMNVQALTSYLVGASYTGVPGLKVAVVYNRNTVGTNNENANSLIGGGASKLSNNAIYAGTSYRWGNWEPRLSYQHVSNTSGSENYGGQDGANQWTANVGYYLSKRTQVYGIVSGLKNNANSVYNLASGGTSLQSTGGQSFLTYGMGMRTNF
ncbi:porin [Fluviibacter phosphoraccumulans]|uniref:porin n=1 Tax=Fluviibacter phosphoraccumulans TaxID=1751046 RepID=UPI0010B8338B|nr:porin [Fluviibacter phosphoraccumulans]BCA66101.1 porin [Fluviibacter phosphoraccumulans]